MMLKVMSRPTVLLIGALSLTAGWLVGTSASPKQQDAPAAGPRSGPRPLGMSADAAPFTRQLRERLDSKPARTPSVGRNPFVFGARRPSVVARDSEEPLAAPPPLPLALPAPPAPQFRLSGIASSQQDGVSVLTAIVNDNGSLAFVKMGDKLSNGFTVVRVDETAVVIADAGGVPRTLRLP